MHPKAPPAADRVYGYVKQSVLDRTFAGGTLLVEGEIAEAVGVSRTPVREALLRLEAEGLLKLYPKKGALVLPVSAQEIADVVETRLLVERYAVRKVLPASPELLGRLADLLAEQRALVEAGDLQGASAVDRAFHHTIVAAAGNRILEHLYDQLRDRQLRMGVQVMRARPERVRLNLSDHADILDALREGDGEAAERLVSRHVERLDVLLRSSAAP
ncbi:GntR family transcriptional regulator [Peterkaempfera bronchialis]|uniref:GntR family transcriptional regulator n=1 Tax=Peterkaempfera bronchialis TaxID=2126346 RepID=A0A345SXW6_9ACTN|nr:GntR family transcriptional regulator [Peterkaempfera bronchialis]AXI78571.1 GntR family transcriptional regulator [Peterkaempfera bronchialis]